MMRHPLKVLVFAAAAFTATASLTASAAVRQESKEKGESERPVKMSRLPAAVQQTVREQSRGARIRGLSVETENGVTNYEVELKVDGHSRDVLIDPSGAVVSVEEQVTLASLPEAVKAAITKGGGRVVLVESVSKGGAIEAYEAHVRRGRKTVEIKVGPEGQTIP